MHNEIKAVSGQGASPIHLLIVAGHGNGSHVCGWKGKQGRPEGKVGDMPGFNENIMKMMDQNRPPSFQRAKQKKGPVRCWFTVNAEARFPGCDTSDVAKGFAEHVLRQNAFAYGTNQAVSHQVGYFKWHRLNEHGQFAPNYCPGDYTLAKKADSPLSPAAEEVWDVFMGSN